MNTNTPQKLDYFYVAVLCYSFTGFFSPPYYATVLSLLGILTFVTVFYAYFKDYREQVHRGLILMCMISFFYVFF